MESETISMKFWYSVKIHWYILVFGMDLFYLCTILKYIGHLENTGLLSYADLPNVETLHCIKLKHHHC